MGREGSDEMSTVEVPPDTENGPPSYGRHVISQNDPVLRHKVRREMGDLSDFEFAIAYADGRIPDQPDGSVREDPVTPKHERRISAANRISHISQMSIVATDERKIYGPEFVAMENLPPKRINLPDYAPKKGNVTLKEVRVTLLNGERLDISCDPDTLGQSLFDAVLDYMAIPEHYFFGIAYMKDGEAYFIEPDTKLQKVAPKEWREAGKNRHGSLLNLIFHTHLRTKFYPDCVHRVNHASTRHLLYLQLRRDVLDERHPLPNEELFALSGLALQAEFGDHTASRCGRGYCHAEHYLPGTLIRLVGLTVAEERMVKEHKANSGLTQAEAEVRFIEQLQQQELYGVHLYKIARDKNDRSGLLYLGVDPVGIKIVEIRGTVRTVLLDYPWLNTEKISFNKRRFSILPKTDVKIGQKQNAKASYYTSSYRKGRYLLRFCTDQHTFRLRHKADWESGNYGNDNPSYIHAEDIDDFESDGVVNRMSSRVRMRKVLPSPSSVVEEVTNGVEDEPYGVPTFSNEDIFVDYSTDEDVDRESEAINSPRLNPRQHMAPSAPGDFDDLEKASQPQELIPKPVGYDIPDGSGVNSPRKIIVRKESDKKADSPSPITRRSGRSAMLEAKVKGTDDPTRGSGLGASAEKGLTRMPDVLMNGSSDGNRTSTGSHVSDIESVSSRSGRHVLSAEAPLARSQSLQGPGDSTTKPPTDNSINAGRQSTLSAGTIPPPPAFGGDRNSSRSCSSKEEVFESPQPRKRRSPKRFISTGTPESRNGSVVSSEGMGRSSNGRGDRGREMEVVLTRGSGTLGLNVTGGVNTSVRDGGIYVKSIVPGSCAEKDGNILVGDRVLSVDEVSVTGMTHRQAVELLRASGTTAVLRIWRDHPRGLDLLDGAGSTPGADTQPTVIASDDVKVERVVTEYPLLVDQLREAFVLTVALPNTGSNGAPPSLGLHLLDPMPEELAYAGSEQFVRITRHGDTCPPSLRRALEVGDLLLEANDEPLLSTDDVRVQLWECGPGGQLRLLIGRPREAPEPEPDPDPAGEVVHAEMSRLPDGSLPVALAGAAEVTGGCYVRKLSTMDPEVVCGLRPGDKLLTANGFDITNMSHDEATKFLQTLDAPINVRAVRPPLMSTDNEDEILADDGSDHGRFNDAFDLQIPSSNSVTPVSLRSANEAALAAHEVDSPPVPMRRHHMNNGAPGLFRPHSYMEMHRHRVSPTDCEISGSLTARSSEGTVNHPAIDSNHILERRHMRCKSEPIIDEYVAANQKMSHSNKAIHPQTRVMRITLHKPDITSSLGFSIVTVDKEDLKGVFIKALVPGGLAHEDGRLRVGDRLLQINGESVIGLTNRKVVNLLKKPKSVVTVAISRPFAAIRSGTTSDADWTPAASIELSLSAGNSVHSSADKSLSDSSSFSHVQKDLRDIFQEYGYTANSDLDGLVASNIEHSNLNHDLFDAGSDHTPSIARVQYLEAEAEQEDRKEKNGRVLRSTSAVSSKVDLDDLLQRNLSDDSHLNFSCGKESVDPDTQSNSSPSIGGEKIKEDAEAPNPPGIESLRLFDPIRPNRVSSEAENDDMEGEIVAACTSQLRVSPSNTSPQSKGEENCDGHKRESPSLLASVTHRLLSDQALAHLTDDYVEQLPMLQLHSTSRLHDTGELNELIEEVREAMEDDSANEEYRDLRLAKRKEEHECECGQREVNKPRNRYRNVLPYDDTRVRLRDVEVSDSDYINASHIRLQFGPRELKVIAAQGPLPSTVGHFWQMVVEQGVKVIAMVTQAVENDKVKCHIYWPSSRTQPLITDKYHIHLEEEAALRSLSVRRFHVIRPSTNRVIQRVFHLNYTAWPDQGIPVSATPLLNYISLLREIHSTLPYPGPLLVHCSAGIGRTGALITLLSLVHALEADLIYTSGQQELQSDQFNIPDIVRKLRCMRPGMIQTKDQYEFCYVALFELLNYIAQERTALL